MTRVTIKTPAIRGIISIFAKNGDRGKYLALGRSYKEMEFSAQTLGEAIDTFLVNIGSLERSDESVAKGKARAIKTAATRLVKDNSATGSARSYQHKEQSAKPVVPITK
jgi:hypothetical protein